MNTLFIKVWNTAKTDSIWSYIIFGNCGSAHRFISLFYKKRVLKIRRDYFFSFHGGFLFVRFIFKISKILPIFSAYFFLLPHFLPIKRYISAHFYLLNVIFQYIKQNIFKRKNPWL